MAKIKNISSLGDLDIPSLGITVKAGETVDVADDAAASLLEQSDNWVAGDKSSTLSTSAKAVDPSTSSDTASASN